MSISINITNRIWPIVKVRVVGPSSKGNKSPTGICVILGKAFNEYDKLGLLTEVRGEGSEVVSKVQPCYMVHCLHPCIKSKPTQYFSPVVPIFFHMVFFSIKNIIWPPDPLNKEKIDFLLKIWAPWSFYY